MSVSIQSVASATAIVATLSTTLVVLAGAPLAFEKLKSQPSLTLDISGRWLTVDHRVLLQVCIAITNTSTRRSKLILEQTGPLRVSTLAATEPARTGILPWMSQGTFSIFTDVSWLEPKECWSNDILIDIGVSAPVITLLAARFIWRPSRRRRKLTTSVQRIVLTTATVEDPTSLPQSPG